jgi:hypothetical protein
MYDVFIDLDYGYKYLIWETKDLSEDQITTILSETEIIHDLPGMVYEIKGVDPHDPPTDYYYNWTEEGPLIKVVHLTPDMINFLHSYEEVPKAVDDLAARFGVSRTEATELVIRYLLENTNE